MALILIKSEKNCSRCNTEVLGPWIVVFIDCVYTTASYAHSQKEQKQVSENEALKIITHGYVCFIHGQFYQLQFDRSWNLLVQYNYVHLLVNPVIGLSLSIYSNNQNM